MSGNDRPRYFDPNAPRPDDSNHRDEPEQPFSRPPRRPVPFHHIFGDGPPNNFRDHDGWNRDGRQRRSWRRGPRSRPTGRQTRVLHDHHNEQREGYYGGLDTHRKDEEDGGKYGGYSGEATSSVREGLGTGSEVWRGEEESDGRYAGQRRRRQRRSGPERFAEAAVEDRKPNTAAPKRQKRVAGGRIHKHVKTQEYDAQDLYCEVCSLYIRDQAMKAGHDMSIEHQRELGFQAKEREKARLAEIEGRANREKGQLGGAVPAMARADGNPATTQKLTKMSPGEVAQKWKEIQPELMGAPKFRAWANKSLEEAMRLAKEEGDTGIVRAVQLEVMNVLIDCTENSRLYTTAWSLEPLASGLIYRDATADVVGDFSVTAEQVKEAEEKKLAERRGQMEIDKVKDDEKEEEKEKQSRHWVRGGLMEHTTRVVDGSASKPVEPVVDTPAVVRDVTEVPGMAGAVEVPDDEPPQVGDDKKVPITWKLSSGAWRFMLSCQGENGKLIRVRYRQWMRREKKNISVEVRKTEPFEQVLKDYSDLRRSFESGDYIFDEWNAKVGKVVNKLGERGTRIGSLEKCLQMQVQAAIQGERWGECFSPCNELVKIYKHRLSKRKRNETVEDVLGTSGDSFICYWILSFLFSNANIHMNRRRRKRESANTSLLGLAERMRGFPPGALGQLVVHGAIKAFSAAVFNNYVQFCRQYAANMMHIKTEQQSRYMMEELVDVVRERAVLLMTRVSTCSEDLVYSAPVQINLDYLVRILCIEGDNGEAQGDAEAVAARGFVEGLPQGVQLGGVASFARNAVLMGSVGKAEVRRGEVVDVDMLVRCGGKGWKVCAAVAPS